MAERTLPAARAPRTVTVRVRPLVVGVAVLVVAAVVILSLRWATGLQPISAGGGSTAPLGLTPFGHTNDTYDTGPTVYRWRRGGRYVVALYLHNSASVPITITGADRTLPDWEGEFTGPTLGLTDEHRPSRYTPFHPVRIPANGSRSVTFVFTANPRACAHPEDKMPGTSTTDSVTIHFTTLGILHGTQTVPLGWATLDMAAPTSAACA